MLLLCLQLLTRFLKEKEWKNNSEGDVIAKFSFVDKQITATPGQLHGPGWKATIVGNQAVSYNVTMGCVTVAEDY